MPAEALPKALVFDDKDGLGTKIPELKRIIAIGVAAAGWSCLSTSSLRDARYFLESSSSVRAAIIVAHGPDGGLSERLDQSVLGILQREDKQGLPLMIVSDHHNIVPTLRRSNQLDAQIPKGEVERPREWAEEVATWLADVSLDLGLGVVVRPVVLHQDQVAGGNEVS